MPRGDGYLRKRGSGVWYWEFMHRGRRYTIRIGKVSKTVAKEIASEIKAQILRDEFVPQRRAPTFREIAQEYMDWYITHSRARQRSKEAHIARIKRLIDHFGGYPLDRISWVVVENYKRKRLAETSKVTINKELRILKTIIKRAIELGMYNGNMPDIELFPDREREIVKALTPEEAERLVSACPEWFKPVVIFALNTGLRAGEIFSLRWEQVDFEKEVILLEKSTTKTKDAYRVFMNATVKELLLKLKKEQEERGINHGYIFTNRYGLPYKYEDKTYRRVFVSACKKAGIKGFRFHDLRHTFASWVAMNSRDIYAVQKLLNHKDIKMTKRYVHLTDDYLRNVVGNIPNFGSISSNANDRDREMHAQERETTKKNRLREPEVGGSSPLAPIT